MDGVRIELADPQGQLLEEIGNPAMKRRDVAMTYRLALRNADHVDWPAVNRAIVDRWSLSALAWIKHFAWQLDQPEAKICSGCAAIIERGGESYPDNHWEWCEGGEAVAITQEAYAAATSRALAPECERPEAAAKGEAG